MEDIKNFNSIKNAIIEIISSNKKEIIGNYHGIIKEVILLNNDKILIEVIDEFSLYKGFVLNKSEIFPTPKKGEMIEFKKIILKTDDEDDFKLRIFIHEFNKNPRKQYQIQKEKEIYDFSLKNIISQFKILLNIKYELKTSLFYINKIEQEKITLRALNNLEDYYVEKKQFNNSSEKEFFLINNYSISGEKNIILNTISIFNKLKEFQLFKYLQNNSTIYPRIFIGKVIEINYYPVKSIIFIDRFKKILKLENQLINNFSFKLFQFCLIINYEINENDEIIINNNSFIHLSSQNIYFCELLLNNFSVIRFNIPDFKNQNNFYSEIFIEGNNKLITTNKFYFVVVHPYENYYDFYPIKIILKQSNSESNFKIFTFILIHGILNNINCFINYYENKAYFYEYFYYSFISYNLPSNLNVIIDKSYMISSFDSFDSEKRRRFNVLNVPENKNFKVNDIESNSFQICMLLEIKEIKNIGLFNLNEIQVNDLEDNSYFDKYYDIFGDIVDQINNNLELNKFINYCQNIYNNNKIDYDYAHNSSNFNQKINKSQLKTRIGIVLCFYIGKNLPSLKNILDLLLKKIINLNKKCIKYHLKNYEQLNIISFTITQFFLKKNNSDIIFLDELNENSPYKLAYVNNRKEIEFLNENSYLFFCYMQLNSFILTNYLANKEKSYHLTMENLFILKQYLLPSYKKFFVIEDTNENKFASFSEYFKIIKINEKLLFPDYKYNEVKDYNNINISKDLAVPISNCFRHENNGHRIRSLKNPNINSPTIYFKREGMKKLLYSKEGKINGESGQIVESFIGTKEEIYNIDCSRHLGDILDYNYFIQENFDNLKNKIKELDYLKTIKPPIFNYIDLYFGSGEKKNFLSCDNCDNEKETDLKKNLIEDFDACCATIPYYLHKYSKK